jgi:uncharacterized membrane protein YeaQ/YmgE (transglycosylase-associated protein family)
MAKVAPIRPIPERGTERPSGAFSPYPPGDNGFAPAPGETLMSILAWLVLGLVAGFIASKLVNRTGSGIIMDLFLGVIGAFVGGFLFTRFGAAGVSGLNLYSFMVATLGAVVVLVIFHALEGRRRLF